MDGFVQTLFDGSIGNGSTDPRTVMLIVLFAFVIGQVIGWVYMWTHKGLSYSQTFVVSLVVLPVIVAVMMMMMTMRGGVMVAFGLLAVFAMIRFRNVLKDTRDTTFILWSIMQGLGVGMQHFSESLIVALGISAVFGYLRVTSFGSRHRYDAVLSLQLTGNLESLTAELKRVLHNHCARMLLANQRRTGADSANVSYRVLLRNPERSNELQIALESWDGFGNVSLFLREDESEV